MIDESRAISLAAEAVAQGIQAAGATRSDGHGSIEAEAVLTAERGALTRFTDFAIHQNVAEDDARLSLRVVIDGRTGVAATNRFEASHLADLAAKAVHFANDSPPDPGFLGLPRQETVEGDFSAAWVEATAEATPALRAQAVLDVFGYCKSAGVAPAGSVATREGLIAVANSRGVSHAARATEAEASLVCTAPGGETGWAECITRDVGALDAEALARRAAGKALAARDAQPVEPGRWTVVLEPAATGELVSLLSYCGFGALAEQEGTSFMSGRLGQMITSEKITIVDDALDSRTLGWPFDFEGVPHRRVPLVESGAAVGVVYDSYTAGRAHTHSTGHALPAPNPFGPAAINLVLASGDATCDELIAGTKKGLLVTRFFYTNPLDPKKTTMTGMTRDGLFRIEDGAVVGAARNLRCTESILEAFARANGLGSEVETHRGTVGTVVAPAMRIEDFTFTSATEF